MKTHTTNPMALQSALMLLSMSGTQGRIELDMSLEQIRQTIFYFGGSLEVVRTGDDTGQQWLTYRNKLGEIDLIAHHSINNHIFTLQLGAFGSHFVNCEAGSKFMIADNKYLIP